MNGVTLARFEIAAKLGEGGMGEVYRAVDSTLGREVALKVLPEAVAGDPEWLARFEREARVLAALSHPNIAAIHEVGTAPAPNGAAGDVHFLVMELAPGETLADRLQRGPLPLSDALSIAVQIAEGLEAAHAKGIVHRDLKPANIMVDDRGGVKILDFGLAKAIQSEANPADYSQAPTLAEEVTRQGLVVGTAGYMSPEQARGLPVDGQTDIWALGCVLFEMLCGRKAFPGTTVTDTLAAVLEHEPDWTLMTRDIPAPLKRLLRRCLAKETYRRVHHVGDAALELREIQGSPTAERESEISSPGRGSRFRLWAAAGAVTAVALILAGWALLRPHAPPPTTPIHLTVATPPLSFADHPAATMVALSPDGRNLAYIVGSGEGGWATTGQLYVRPLDSFVARAISGAEEAYAPFFSPDGEWIGFFSGGSLRRVRVSGGKPQVICKAGLGIHGATWGPDGTIVFAVDGGLSSVAATGGKAERLLSPSRPNEFFLLYPYFLADGARLLFTAGGPGGEAIEVDILGLKTGERRRVMEGGGNAAVRQGHEFLVARDGKLWSAPFDSSTGRLAGPLSVVVDDLFMGFAFEPALGHFAVSSAGALAYVPGPFLRQGGRLVRVDRAGKSEPLSGFREGLMGPRWSPNGKEIAVSAGAGEQGSQIWILDVERNTFTPLMMQSGQAWWPEWTRDGTRLAFTGVEDEGGDQVGLYLGTVDGSEPIRRIAGDPEYVYNALGWSLDGSTLLAHRSDMATSSVWDLMTIRVDDSTSPTPLLASPAAESQASLSPDGRWIAYVSDLSGRPEVYVRSFNRGGGRWQVSTNGGVEPAWSADGGEIFYRTGMRSSSGAGPGMMSVSVETDPEMRLARPHLLFEGEYSLGPDYGRNYDVSPDGSGFVMVEPNTEDYEPTGIHLILEAISDRDS